MKKNTIKTLVLITVILFGLTQANAVVDVDLADKLTNSIWSNEQVNELSKDDTIVKLAWSIQEEVVDIQNENNIRLTQISISHRVDCPLNHVITIDFSSI